MIMNWVAASEIRGYEVGVLKSPGEVLVADYQVRICRY